MFVRSDYGFFADYDKHISGIQGAVFENAFNNKNEVSLYMVPSSDYYLLGNQAIERGYVVLGSVAHYYRIPYTEFMLRLHVTDMRRYLHQNDDDYYEGEPEYFHSHGIGMYVDEEAWRSKRQNGIIVGIESVSVHKNDNYSKEMPLNVLQKAFGKYNMLSSVVEGLFQMLNELYPDVPARIIYLGAIDDKSEFFQDICDYEEWQTILKKDQALKEIFQKNGFGVCHCLEASHYDDVFYAAFYDSEAFKSEAALKAQRETPWEAMLPPAPFEPLK